MLKRYPFLNRFLSVCPKSGKTYLKPVRNAGWLFPMWGLIALVWYLIRVVPKPSRAAYPCMQVAAPMATSFLIYIGSFFTSFIIFKKVRALYKGSAAVITFAFIFIFVFASTLVFTPVKTSIYATALQNVEDPLGPNNPVGEPKGILPGRVVWSWNPQATNENCVPNKYNDAYFSDNNCNQDIVDDMLANAMLMLTDEEDQQAAWDKVFHHFNQNRGKGDVGYQDGETIFIKVNAVHAWTTSSTGDIKNDGSYGNVDTSPQAVMAMLRQLVYQAGIPQENIYIGDPFTHIFTHCLDKWRAEFPNIHYMDNRGNAGREKYNSSNNYLMEFSDKGSVLQYSKDRYYTEMENADYLLDIPAMKGHRWGGVTLFGKNFFGANTRGSAAHMHPGLHREDYDEPLRGEYGMYRVFVDLLGHKDLGGKVLIYFMDALWSCSYEHEPAVKFKMAPFNNDWTSSILLSLDPIAIESVCLDILQAEFPKVESEVEGDYWYANFPACDDYLHQCADSQYWPEDIVYDPEGDGTPISSLGVHEHWNNATDQQYTRNLGTGEGIELVKYFTTSAVESDVVADNFILQQNYPNPFNPTTDITFQLPQADHVNLSVYDVQGRHVCTLTDGVYNAGSHIVRWQGVTDDGLNAASGVYFYHIRTPQFSETRRMTLVR